MVHFEDVWYKTQKLFGTNFEYFLNNDFICFSSRIENSMLLNILLEFINISSFSFLS